jgi:acylphosphatase
MEVGVHIIVEGLVQGVGFRWFVARRAEAMGLRGHTRNLYDGTVEVEASGDRAVLEELIGVLKAGPRAAHVTNLRIEWTQASSKPGFEIR